MGGACVNGGGSLDEMMLDGEKLGSVRVSCHRKLSPEAESAVVATIKRTQMAKEIALELKRAGADVCYLPTSEIPCNDIVVLDNRDKFCVGNYAQCPKYQQEQKQRGEI